LLKNLFTVVSVVVLALGGSGLVFAQTDAHMGTWKLNVAKSKFDPAHTLKSEIRTYESTSDGYKLSGQRVDADGSNHPESFTAKYDGKDTPFVGDAYGADTLAVKLVDPNHINATEKKGGKLLYTTKLVVSNDGKVMTITNQGKTESGKPLNAVLVYDKQ
jgi:hypothetical protein